MQCRVLLPPRCPNSEWFSDNSKPDVIVMLNLFEIRSWSMQNSWFQVKTLWKLSTDYMNVFNQQHANMSHTNMSRKLTDTLEMSLLWRYTEPSIGQPSSLLGKLEKVRIIGSSKQMTGNKQINKWMRRECKYHAHFTSQKYRLIFWQKTKQQSFINIHGWTLNLNWSDMKVKTKNWYCYLKLKSMFRTSVQCFLFDLSLA